MTGKGERRMREYWDERARLNAPWYVDTSLAFDLFKGETAFKLATASWFYRLFNKLAQVDLEPNSGDFRLLDRRALDALLAMTERSRFLRGMTVWVGFNQTAISYERDARQAGETKYTLRKMLRFSLDAITSFSHTPLQLATYVGMLSAGVAFIAIPVVIVLRIFDSYLPGFGSITIAILLLGGIQLIALGIISLPKMHSDVLPELSQGPVLEVQTEALGLSSQEVEQYITVPMENNPRVVFERMFGDGGTPSARRVEMMNDRSILDWVTEDMARLQRRLGSGDRTKVAEYIDSVREVERRIQ